MPDTTTPTYFVMLDFDQSVDSGTDLDAMRAVAKRVLATEPLACSVSIMDDDGNVIEDLGMTSGKGPWALKA